MSRARTTVGAEPHEERFSGSTTIQRDLEKNAAVAVTAIREECIDPRDGSTQMYALGLAAGPLASTFHAKLLYQSTGTVLGPAALDPGQHAKNSPKLDDALRNSHSYLIGLLRIRIRR